MSDEYRNINQPGTEPENNEEENTSFVLQNEDGLTGEEEKHQEQQASVEPQEAPTQENPYYAQSYRKASEKREAESSNPHREREYSSYRFTSPIPPETQPKKKKENPSMGIGRKLGVAAACAAVFGLVAGVVFQGVGYVSDQLLPDKTIEIDKTQVANASGTNTSGSGSQGGTVSEVAANVMPSIVAITGISVQEVPNYFGYYFGFGGSQGGQTEETQSSGSGIIVGQNDTELLIATNNHVVADTDSITVCFTNQDGTAASSADQVTNTSTQSGESSQELDAGSAVAAQVKGTDADNDLAVVAVQLSDIPEDVLSEIRVANLGSSDELTVGEQVVAIGNALGYGQSVTSGYVSALNKQVESENVSGTFLQTDAAINPGNSGGALLNMSGEVIGINSSKIASSEVEGMGFAIPISRAEPILNELMSKETRQKVEDESKAAYLGITCIDVTSNTEQMYNIPVGVCVNSVEENGPADKAGVKKGDIIRKIDGTSVESYENLTAQLQYYEAGEQVDFVIARADGGEYKEQTITIELGAKKDAQQSSQSNSRSGR